MGLNNKSIEEIVINELESQDDFGFLSLGIPIYFFRWNSDNEGHLDADISFCTKDKLIYMVSEISASQKRINQILDDYSEDSFNRFSVDWSVFPPKYLVDYSAELSRTVVSMLNEQKSTYAAYLYFLETMQFNSSYNKQIRKENGIGHLNDYFENIVFPLTARIMQIEKQKGMDWPDKYNFRRLKRKVCFADRVGKSLDKEYLSEHNHDSLILDVENLFIGMYKTLDVLFPLFNKICSTANAVSEFYFIPGKMEDSMKKKLGAYSIYLSSAMENVKSLFSGRMKPEDYIYRLNKSPLIT